MCPDKGNKAGEKAGRNDMGGAAKDFRLVWFAENEAEEQPSCPQLPEEGMWRERH